MVNINLTHLSFFIMIIWLSSFFVNADQSSTHNVAETTVLNATNLQEVEEVKGSSNRFTFSSLDSDKNGKLSKKEVAQGRNNWLVQAFNQIDINEDSALTEQELVDFAAKVASNSEPTT